MDKLSEHIDRLRNYRREVLGNGAVVCYRSVDAPDAMIQVGVKYGAAHSPKEEIGLPHLVEHVSFKPNSLRRTDINTELLDLTGRQPNATTYPDYIEFPCRMPVENTEKVLDIFYAMLAGRKPLEEDFEKERLIVLNEGRPTPISRLFQAASHDVYPGHPYAGDMEIEYSNVSRFHHSEFDLFRDKAIVGSTLIICYAGSSPYEEILAKTNSTFGQIKRGEPPKDIPAPKNSVKNRYAENFSGLPQPSYNVFYRLSTGDAGMHNILSAYLDEKLFIKLREDTPLCYSIGTGITRQVSGAHLTISSQKFKKEDAGLIEAKIEEVIEDFKRIEPAELTRIKDRNRKTFYGRTLGKFGSNVSTMSDHEIFGYSVLDIFKQIQGLQAEEVAELAAKQLVNPIKVTVFND